MEHGLELMHDAAGVFVFLLALAQLFFLFGETETMWNLAYRQSLDTHEYYVSSEEYEP